MEFQGEITYTCNHCGLVGVKELFLTTSRSRCKACNNLKRRTKYKSNESHRRKLILVATEFKQKRSNERRIKKELEIGHGNKKCSNCHLIKPSQKFRFNRLKCKDCERDDPLSKLIRKVRSRIWSSLVGKKEKHTIEYLGCNCAFYLSWMSSYSNEYTIENHGKDWHIDHVIPLSKFDLSDNSQQLLAFNWRNTMPLSVKENLSKNNKIISGQIEKHVEKLHIYHNENGIEFPTVFIELFAKHLVAGTPLELFATKSTVETP